MEGSETHENLMDESKTLEELKQELAKEELLEQIENR